MFDGNLLKKSLCGFRNKERKEVNKLDRILFNKLIEEVPAFNYEGISQKTLDRAAALI